MKLSSSALLMLLVVLTAAQVCHSQTVTHNYSLTIDSDLEMELQGQKQEIAAKTILSYYHLVEDEKLAVGLDDIAVQVNQGSTSVLDVFQNKDEIREGESTTKVADANDELKKILTDSFSAPLAEFKRDENGELSEQKIVAKPGAKSLTDNGQIENLLFLHPPFFEDKKTWEAPAKFSLGNGNFARGKLKYTFKSKKDDKVTVDVSGELEPTGKQSMLTISDGAYKISGIQVYDLKTKRWDSAEIKLDVSFGLDFNDNRVGDSSGVMNISLKPTTKKAETKKNGDQKGDSKGTDSSDDNAEEAGSKKDTSKPTEKKSDK